MTFHRRVQNEKVMSASLQPVHESFPQLLLIDDDLSLSKLIREYCETDGLKVMPVPSGEEGNSKLGGLTVSLELPVDQGGGTTASR